MPARAALADACLLGGNTVLEWHRALVASGRFSPDERQNEAALLLQKFADEIVAEAKTTRARAQTAAAAFSRAFAILWVAIKRRRTSAPGCICTAESGAAKPS